MLPRLYKLLLRKQPDFFRRAARKHLEQYSIYSKPAQSFQLTVIVSKKVARLATERNEIKRRYYSGIVSVLPQLVQKKQAVVLLVHRQGKQITRKMIAEKIVQNYI